MSQSDYLIVLTAGYQADPAQYPQARIVDVTPAAFDTASIHETLAATGLNARDLRTRALFLTGLAAHDAVKVYAGVCGLAARHIDIADADGVPVLLTPVEQALSFPKGHRPGLRDLELVVSSTEHPELPTVLFAAAQDVEALRRIHFASRVRLILDPAVKTSTALLQLAAISTIRTRDGATRLPVLCDGSEPVFEDATPSTLPPVGFDLQAVADEAQKLRGSSMANVVFATAPKARLSDRQRRLVEAAQLPLDQTLVRLGAAQDERGMWHCPRPERHRNGDRNASLTIGEDGMMRCYRCDKDRIDSLRLVMDTKGWVADEAATWLLSHTA